MKQGTRLRGELLLVRPGALQSGYWQGSCVLQRLNGVRQHAANSWLQHAVLHWLLGGLVEAALPLHLPCRAPADRCVMFGNACTRTELTDRSTAAAARCATRGHSTEELGIRELTVTCNYTTSCSTAACVATCVTTCAAACNQ